MVTRQILFKIHDLATNFSDNELVATLLDIRTAHCKHLTKDQHKEAMAVFEKEYVKYYRRAKKFERGLLQQRKIAEIPDKNS